jgi:hypothetical protein
MVSQHFTVYETSQRLIIRVLSHLPFRDVSLYVDDQYAGTFPHQREFNIDKAKIHLGTHVLYVVASYDWGGKEHQVQEGYIFQVSYKRGNTEWRQPSSDFRAGDILVACDNANGLPPGYMGHSALVVDEQDLIESVMVNPSIRKASVDQFLKAHPMHAHFRPKIKEVGQKATEYAENYLLKYNENLEQGINSPQFSFLPSQDLKDEWGTIFCSKLVWLAYYYGADYRFEVNGMWFSPQNLYADLIEDENFELLYIHPEFSYKIEL